MKNIHLTLTQAEYETIMAALYFAADELGLDAIYLGNEQDRDDAREDSQRYSALMKELHQRILPNVKKD